MFVILDNMAAHTGIQMSAYIKSSKGDAVLWFLPSRTPQHNPIEIQWREIRRAVADIFFGGLDELQKRIRQLCTVERCPWSNCSGTCKMPSKIKTGHDTIRGSYL